MLPHHPTAGRPRDAVFMHIAHIPTITLGRAAAAQSLQDFLVIFGGFEVFWGILRYFGVVYFILDVT